MFFINDLSESTKFITYLPVGKVFFDFVVFSNLKGDNSFKHFHKQSQTQTQIFYTSKTNSSWNSKKTNQMRLSIATIQLLFCPLWCWYVLWETTRAKYWMKANKSLHFPFKVSYFENDNVFLEKDNQFCLSIEISRFDWNWKIASRI